MNYRFAVTGIGFCVGNIADHEDLIVAITTQKKPGRQIIEPTARYAIQRALNYKDEKPVLMITIIRFRFGISSTTETALAIIVYLSCATLR